MIGEGDMQALRIVDERPSLALDLPDGTTFGQWLSIGRNLRLGSQALNWHIGDWWKFGVSHWGEDETRKSALEIWGVEGETARVYGWVATKFDPVRRLTELSFSHYQKAASLPADDAARVITKARDQGLSVRDVQREVQAIKAANDPELGHQPTTEQRDTRTVPADQRELVDAYQMVIELADALSEVRPLSRKQSAMYQLAMACVAEAFGDRRPVPEDFKIIFVEQGRLACEEWYQVSRRTVDRWLLACGKTALIKERAAFVKYGREVTHRPQQKVVEQPVIESNDPMEGLASVAANFLRMRRHGGWMISKTIGGWRVGTVFKTSDQVIVMAERQGFDSEAALQDARAEGVEG